MPTAVITEKQILDALRAVKDPDLGKDIVELNFVKNLQIRDGSVSFAIELTTPACPVKEQMHEQARRAVMSVSGVDEVDIQMTANVRGFIPLRGPKPGGAPSGAPATSPVAQKIQSVKNIIPIASGKGGVGKSTVSANIAVALASRGAKVGLLDADVYGPSIPKLLGISQKGVEQKDGKLLPVEKYGVKVISVGFLVPAGEAVIWRGPLLHRTMEQFLTTVDWGELDYLILDLPPGTGDIQISICQLVALTGAVVVSTPQDVALEVAEKAIFMFGKLNAPILGMVENMSYFICPHCGEREEIFSSGGAEHYCREKGIPFLGGVPLATSIRQKSDEGMPIVMSEPKSTSAEAFFHVAENLAAQISVVNMGGGAATEPEPIDIRQPKSDEIHIIWKGGGETRWKARDLRALCPCAMCVDEITGERRIGLKDVPDDITCLSIRPVGRYALQFNWSDGHYTGVYTFGKLRGEKTR